MLTLVYTRTLSRNPPSGVARISPVWYSTTVSKYISQIFYNYKKIYQSELLEYSFFYVWHIDNRRVITRTTGVLQLLLQKQAMICHARISLLRRSGKHTQLLYQDIPNLFCKRFLFCYHRSWTSRYYLIRPNLCLWLKYWQWWLTLP